MLMRLAASSTLAAAFAFTLAGAAAPDAAPAADPGSPIRVLERPVRVVALPSPPVAADYPLTFRLALEHGAECCTLETTIRIPDAPTTVANAVRRLRRTIGWRHGYLFVRTECGGGNAWKCMSESVFRVRNGRLVGLGTLATRSVAEGIATSWRNGMFWDADTDLEINELTSHGGAPWFELRLRERDGRLVADIDSTWAANAREYAARDSASLANAKPPGAQETWDSVISPRLGNAAVARYCGRANLLAAILAEARGVLPADRFATFQAVIARIEPGALPRSSAPPVVVERGH
jgi:hypothetical protein